MTGGAIISARATFTGQVTVQRYVNGVFEPACNSGGHTFTVHDFDGDLIPYDDRVAIGRTRVHSSNQAVKQLGSRADLVTLGGRNVLIQAK